MKRLALAVLFCLPSALLAQETSFGSVTQQLETDPSLSSASFVAADASLTSGASGTSPSAPAPPPPAPPRGSTSAKAKNKEPSPPPVEGSMVGYIDNAIVGSEIRVRFDAAFGDQFPDRSEFFYAKCSCYRQLVGTPAFDPNAAGPGTGIPKKVNFQQLYFDGEYAPVRRFSVFAEIPIRWLQPQGFVSTPFPTVPFPNESGLGDVMAGFKVAPFASADHYLTFQFRTYFPSGNASKGLGTNHY
ncbi:MAG TPA: hypothetical protein VEI49_03530, partial [Terriglobales bacterium]|nr:hypothetical protein [Terriglobales bacterium]